MTPEAIHDRACRTLVFVTLDGRSVFANVIASDAAEELMGKRGAYGLLRQLEAELDYYAEGHPWSIETWEAAREEYAARLDDMGCVNRAAQVRGWQMPAREEAIAAE